jgi:hypothetical protein
MLFDCRMVNDATTIKNTTMKIILMLTFGLMLAACGSVENDVLNHGAPPTSAGPLAGPGDRIAVDTICACP